MLNTLSIANAPLLELGSDFLKCSYKSERIIYIAKYIQSELEKLHKSSNKNIVIIEFNDAAFALAKYINKAVLATKQNGLDDYFKRFSEGSYDTFNAKKLNWNIVRIAYDAPDNIDHTQTRYNFATAALLLACTDNMPETLKTEALNFAQKIPYVENKLLAEAQQEEELSAKPIDPEVLICQNIDQVMREIEIKNEKLVEIRKIPISLPSFYHPEF